jgi:hypothetical protein
MAFQESVYERFVRKINKTETCWLWTDTLHKTGYGYFTITKRPKTTSYVAHRFSWTLFKGPIPEGLHVLHTCDVRHCVNPDHLFLGTASENMKDMVKKGRAIRNVLKGPSHPFAKFNMEQIKQVREMYASGNFSYTKLAKMFHSCPSSISRIVKHQRYKSL